MNPLFTRAIARIACCLLFIHFFFLVPPLHGQLNYLASTEDGSSYEVCLEGGYLYVGAANTLKVYSLVGPGGTPDSNTFSLRLGSNIDQILVRDGFLYVCANHDGLWKFNINTSPDMPTTVAHYAPASIHESIYDVAFYGDSLVVAAKNKVLLLSDSANVISYRTTIASYPDSVRAHGVDIKGNLLAYTVGFGNDTVGGVYLINLNSLQQIGFYNQTRGNAWEVYFGENDSILHIMGGIVSRDSGGLYYAVRYNTPSAMQEVYSNVIPNAALGQAMPMSAKIIHDTVYIATQGGAPFSPSPGCFIYVYDATNPNNIQLIEDLQGGLYHFDIDINEDTRTMYVASEWYGVLTVDIQDLSNDTILSKTLTGGWCHGSAFANNLLVEANEGYGIRFFDLSNRQSPTLIKEDTALGFCRAVCMDDSANYVYAWYLTDHRLRVYDGQTKALVGDTLEDLVLVYDYSKARKRGNYIAVIETVPFLIFEITKILVMDVSNPIAPTVAFSKIRVNTQDLLFHPSGKLVACSYDSIRIYEPSDGAVLRRIAPPTFGNQFRAMALSSDTLYAVHMKSDGNLDAIARYYINPTSLAFTFIDNTAYPLASKHRIHLTTNDTILYIASSLDSLKAISKYPPYAPSAIYDHGADHMYDNIWGVQDLYYSQGLLILNEYMGQSSIFGSPTVVSTPEPIIQQKGLIHPNPAHDRFSLQLETSTAGSLEVFDMNGRKHFASTSYTNGSAISTHGWESGIYFVVWQQGDQRWTGKLVKLE
jgi:hypothetical protein